MSITIDATVGGADANSYVSIAEADAYFEAVLTFTDSWSALDTDKKSARLVAAQRAIDRFNFRSEREDEDQALKFPLAMQENDDVWPETEIPQPVKDAQCEMVIFQFNEADSSTGQASRDVNKVRVEGAVSVEFDRAVGDEIEASLGGNIEAIKDLLRPWLLGDGIVEVSR